MDQDWINPSPVELQYIPPRGDKGPTLVRI